MRTLWKTVALNPTDVIFGATVMRLIWKRIMMFVFNVHNPHQNNNIIIKQLVYIYISKRKRKIRFR